MSKIKLLPRRAVTFDFTKSPCRFRVNQIFSVSPASREHIDNACDEFITGLSELHVHMSDPATKYARNAAETVVRVKDKSAVAKFNESDWRGLPSANFILEMDDIIRKLSHDELRGFALFMMETGMAAMMECLKTGDDSGVAK